MKKTNLLIAAAAAMLSCAPAYAVTGVVQALNDMRALNLITLGDYNGNGIDVEGKAWVGGNLTSGATVGFGHSKNPSQSAANSSYATLTVLGSASGNINLDTGGGVGGNYGAYIGGDLAAMNVNGSNGTIQVGGNVTAQSLNLNSGTTLKVVGSTNAISTNTGSTVSVGGNVNGQANIGNGSSMAVRGNVSGADVSSGASLIAGGSVGNFNGSQNSTVSMGSYAGSNKVSVSSGSSVYVGSSVNQAENNGGLLMVKGSIGDMQGYSQNSVTKATGSIGGNGNGISNSPSYVYAGGSIAGAQNANGNAANVHQNYDYSANGATSAPTTLGTPSVPALTVAGTSTLSTMASNMQALSTALLSQTNNNATSSFFATAGNAQQLTIKATSTGANSVAVINVSEAIFSSFSEINYDFSDPNMIVVINVLNSDPSALANHNATYNFNFNPVGGANASASQQLIWNFADAGTLNVNREEWGSILAPYATVANSGDINGSLVAKIFNQNGEVHLGTFDGSTTFLATDPGHPAAVPEPASWAMMLGGFGAIGTMIRRRRRETLAKAA